MTSWLSRLRQTLVLSVLAIGASSQVPPRSHVAPRRSRPALAGVLVLSGGDRRDQIEKITTALSAAAAAAALATVARASIDSPPPPSSEPEAAIEPAENRSVTPRSHFKYNQSTIKIYCDAVKFLFIELYR